MSKDSSSKSSGFANSMAELMARQKSSFITLARGQKVKGKVTKLTSGEILVDVNAKTEAMVLEKDRSLLRQLLNSLHVGDTVEVTVLNPESDMGYAVVSLRHFAEDKTWEHLEGLKKKGEKIEATVTEATKGGFLVTTDDSISGFLPNSHISLRQNPQSLVGQKIKVTLVDLSRELHKIIFSQKGVLDEASFKKAIEQFTVGQKIHAAISGITSFGVFISLPLENDGQIDGLIHVSELSWEKIATISDHVTVGQEIDAVILGFDKEAKRIDLSIKRLTQDPFEEISKAYPVDKKVTGTVSEISDMGVSVELPEVAGVHVDAMIRKDKIPPTVTYKEGQSITATVTQLDSKKHKVFLTPVLKEKPIGYR